MRFQVVLIALLMLSFPAAAQGADFVEDDGGDVQSSSGAPAPSSMAEVDLRALRILETPRDIVLTIEVADIEPEGQPDVLASAFEVEFQHNGQGFVVYLTRNTVFGGAEFFGQFFQVDAATGRESFLEQLVVEVDHDEETLSVSLPRSLLRDGNGSPPFPGRTLDDFVVTSHANRLFRGDINIGGAIVPDGRFTDRMPDEGGAGPFDIQLGVQQGGTARLSSPEPFRASNGEATTYVFQVRAVNLGDETDTFRFQTTNTPTNWDISVPDGDVEIGANRAITLPIVVGTAFAHNHGSTESFVLEMESTKDPSNVGRVELGVHYPKIPQPAGHHDTLWVHSSGGNSDPFTVVFGDVLGFANSGADGYMNALEDDDSAAEEPIPGDRCGIHALSPGTPTMRMRYCWTIPLDPGLQLGLDFDLERVGAADLRFSSDLPSEDASVTAQLMYAPPGPSDNQPIFFRDDLVRLADLNSTERKSLSGTTSFEFAVEPRPESDFIRYTAGAAMFLEVQMLTLRPENPFFGPKAPPVMLMPGSVLQLPLNEYADPVEEVVSIEDVGLSFEAITEQERRVNPGETVIFKALLANTGNATEVDIDIIGSGRAWATLLSQPVVRVDGETEVLLAVTAPEDAADGEQADLVLEASNVADIEDQTLIRFVATVDSTEDLPDEWETAEALLGVEDKKSPGIGWLVAAALALLVARRRE